MTNGSATPNRAVSLRTWVAVVAASHFVVLAAAFLAEKVLARNPRLISTETAPISRSLTRWDGWWYLTIARDAHHVAPIADGYYDYAFLRPRLG